MELLADAFSEEELEPVLVPVEVDPETPEPVVPFRLPPAVVPSLFGLPLVREDFCRRNQLSCVSSGMFSGMKQKAENI